MENNKNYQKILNNTLLKIDKTVKPSLALHVCCGPCSTIPLKQLDPFFNITIIYANSNIYPEEEYLRRLNELKSYICTHYPHIKIITMDYNNDAFTKIIEPYKDMPEGHERCRICFKNRLNVCFKYALENHFDFCGTVMTISRYKNAQDINKIGLQLEKQFSPVKWLCADFKKNNGYEDSLVVIKNERMYFQEYCGCRFSYEKYLLKLENKCSKK